LCGENLSIGYINDGEEEEEDIAKGSESEKKVENTIFSYSVEFSTKKAQLIDN
jgi:hypothetical protein